MAPIIKILLLIDGVIYDLIDSVYDIFDFLARLNIFGEDSYNDIVGRIYIVLGVIMLFVLAYTLLRAIINPDDFAKGEKSFPNLAKNVVISLILIVLLPTIFNVAFSMQNALLNTGTITKLILGDTNLDYTEKYQNETITMTPGKMMAVNTFSAFFYPNPENPVCGDSGVQGTRIDVENCKDNITADGFIWRNSEITLRQVDTEVKAGKSMTAYNKFSDAVSDDQIHYTVIISTVAGVFLLYVLLNFCFDMALRVVKLMFYQIIAPIPIICRVVPFGTLKDVFNNWLKQVLSTFFEVFVRIAIMNFGVLLIKLCLEAFNSGYRNGILSVGRAEYNLSWLQFSLARLLVIFGIVMFIRKAPELISKMFGIDTGGMKLGLRDKLQQSGVYTAGAAVQSGLFAGANNLRSGISKTRKDFDAAKATGDKKQMRKALWSGVARTGASTIGGFGSGFGRAGYGARSAKSGKEMHDAAQKGTAASNEARLKRANYRASHLVRDAHGNEKTFATTFNVLKGHGTDYIEGVGEKIGFNNLEELQRQKAIADEARGFYTEMSDFVKDNEMVANFAGLYDAEMKREITGKTVDEAAYKKAVDAERALLARDNKHRGLSPAQLQRLAENRVDRSSFERDMTPQEMAQALQERQDNLKRLDELKKLATIKAINEKLADVDADGKIKDGRFQAVANKVKVFKEQHPDVEIVDNMSQIKSVTWQSSWDDIMSGKNFTSVADYNLAVDNLMSEMKKGTAGVSYFSDSENAKNASGAISAEIAKKVQEKKSKE